MVNSFVSRHIDLDGCIELSRFVVHVAQANWEHGVIARRLGYEGDLPDLPVGSLLCISQNYACATAAQLECYYVIAELSGDPLLEWSRLGG